MAATEMIDNSTDLWSIAWQTFENASLTYDLVSTYEPTKFNNVYEINIYENSGKLSIIMGAFIAWIADLQIIPAEFDHCAELRMKTIVSMLLNVACFLMTAPFVALTLAVFFLYRKSIQLILKINVGKNFVGLLEGPDCIWAVEDSSALSVINAMAELEINPSTIEINILEDFRNLIKKRLLTADYEKLCCLREKKYGYYYWKKTDIDVVEQVRWLHDEYHDCDGNCDDIHQGYLRQIVTKITNQPLPRDHKTCWEILIGSNCSVDKIKYQNKIGMKKKTIPLLFRVHHSLGDGVALLRLLLETIVDKNFSILPENSKINDEKCVIRIPILRENSSLHETYRKSSEVIDYSIDLLGVSMPFAKLNTLRMLMAKLNVYLNIKIAVFETYRIERIQAEVNEIFQRMLINTMTFYNEIKISLKELLKNLITLVMLPSCLVQQTLRSMDNSAIHGPPLTGNKIISCWMEDCENSDYHLLAKIRDIKNITGTRFGDIILAALSANLYKYFQQIGEAVPKTISVVLPTRISVPSKKLILNNRFTVGLLPLCIAEVNGINCKYPSDEPSAILNRIYDVAECSKKLRSDPDYLVNQWIMTWLAAALPLSLLRPLLQSHSTLVFSNLPGPSTVAIQGHTLKKIAVWIPNRPSTGISCLLLTYGGNIHLSIIADKAVINNEKNIDEILNGTVHTIEELHKKITYLALSVT